MQTLNSRSTAPNPGETMRAITQQSYGSADVLELRTIDAPTIEADEVLIEVHAAGLDRGVWHLMTGMPVLIRIMGYGFSRPKRPVPGMDVAGRVVAIGAEVTRFEVGDEVFGIGTGTFAELAAAKESKLVRKPANLTFEQAAVSTISGITALQALTSVGRVERGQHVLVIGASGGVGSFAVQIAKTMGATVTGVASTGKLDAVRAMGADHVIDYRHSAIDEGETRYDVIIDAGGRNRLSSLRRALTRTGTLVIVGGEDGGTVTGGIGRQLRAVLISPFTKQRLTTFVSRESLEYIEPLAEHLATGAVTPTIGRRFGLEAVLATGAVTPTIGRRFGLEAVPTAIAAMEAGELTGKAVIVVKD